jgi:hypothetical protein
MINFGSVHRLYSPYQGYRLANSDQLHKKKSSFELSRYHCLRNLLMELPVPGSRHAILLRSQSSVDATHLCVQARTRCHRLLCIDAATPRHSAFFLAPHSLISHEYPPMTFRLPSIDGPCVPCYIIVLALSVLVLLCHHGLCQVVGRQ